MLSLSPRRYTEKLVWTAVAAGSGLVAAVATHNALNAMWKALRDEAPPLNPESPDTSWREALLWTAMTGMAAGVTHLLARRGAMAGWRHVTGSWPPGVVERDGKPQLDRA